MKTKQSIVTMLSVTLLVIGGCKESPKGEASSHADHEKGEATHEHSEGAAFEEGKGVVLPELTRKSIGLQVVEVTEQKFTNTIQLQLQVFRVNGVAHAAGQSAEGKLTKGQAVTLLHSTEAAKIQGEVLQIIKGIGKERLEVIVRAPAGKLAVGDLLQGTIIAESEIEGVAIPKSALLRTINGTFVYVENDKHFLRTEVKTGAESEDFVEITEGLYSGDRVVKSAVMPIWLTELQSIRGGVGCAHGH